MKYCYTSYATHTHWKSYTVVWEKFDVKKKFVAGETLRKLNAQNIFNNEKRSEGSIFDLVLNQMGMAWLQFI